MVVSIHHITALMESRLEGKDKGSFRVIFITVDKQGI